MSQGFSRGTVTFCVSVLWIHGMSIGSIALHSGRTAGSVRGIVNRAIPRPREDMTIDERQILLDTMKAGRRDDLQLPDKYFVALPRIAKSPRKAIASLAMNQAFSKPAAPRKEEPTPEQPPLPKTITARKRHAHKIAQERRRQEQIEAAARKEREQGGARRRGEAASSLEWLYATGMLSDPQERTVDAKRPDGLMSKERRKEAGLSFRACLDSCRVGAVSSVDFEREVRGGGASLGIAWWRLMSLDTLSAIRKALSQPDYVMLEGIVDRDEEPWMVLKSSTARRFLLEQIRRSLDAVAVLWRLMDPAEFERRWGYPPVEVDGLDPDDAKEIAMQARAMIREGLRSA